MNKVRISAVSYTNTLPFIYGLQHAALIEDIDLSLDVPAICAQKLIDNQADIGLVPVAVIPDISGCQIISDFCIGAVSAVNSVYVFSDKEAKDIRTVRLDAQSRTSNQLARVLFKHHWHSSPAFLTEGDADAFVEIGDRTFGKKGKFSFSYDLAEEWIKFTGLPFVFAAWVANKPVPEEFLRKFNVALRNGLDQRLDLIKELEPRSDFDLEDYLMNHIDFDLDTAKRQALDKFLELSKGL